MKLRSYWAVLLAVLLLLSACRTNVSETAPSPTPPVKTPAVTQTPAPTPNPEPTPTPAPAASPTPAPQAVCTVSVTCAELLDRLEDLDEGVQAIIPESGEILPATEIPLEEGDSVFDVLQRICRDNDIHLEFSNTPAYGSAYIEGIANLYETDCGPLSGWSYTVNGVSPNVGCSRYELEPGDVVCWAYHCELSE